MRKGEIQVFITLGVLGFLFLMPLSGDGADLTISNVITGNGNMTLNGAMNATSFSGSGLGLTNLDPTRLSSGTANINISGNAATATSAVTATNLTGGLAGDVTGTQGATTVQRIRGYGVSASQPASNQVLRFSGGSWGASAVNLATDMTGTLPIGSGGTGSSTKNFVDLSGSQTVGGAKTFSSPIASNVPTGTAPLQVASTTMVPNLNAEMLGGQRLSDLSSFYQNKYTKVAVVEPYGHGDYTNPATAMADYQNWCGVPPFPNNPCLLKIMPGFYDITTPSTVQMQPHIDIEGSGELVTVISGTIDNTTTGVVDGAWGAEIRFLTIENRGGSGHTNAIALSNLNKAQTHITNVTVSASGGSHNYGIFNQGDINFYSPAPIMTNVTVFASDGTNTYGIHNFMASPKMNNVTVTVYGGTDTNIGINNVPCVPYTIITNSTINASGGNTSYGIVNQAYSMTKAYLTMTNVTVTANATNSYGIYNNFAFPSMNSVTITASGTINSYGIDNIYSHPTLSTVTISASGGSQYNFAILNEQNSTVSLMNVTSNATDGADSFGILNTNTGGNMTIDHCRISGKRSVRNDNKSATLFIGSSKLIGDVLGPVGTTGTIKCIGVYDGSYSGIACP